MYMEEESWADSMPQPAPPGDSGSHEAPTEPDLAAVPAPQSAKPPRWRLRGERGVYRPILQWKLPPVAIVERSLTREEKAGCLAAVGLLGLGIVALFCRSEIGAAIGNFYNATFGYHEEATATAPLATQMPTVTPRPGTEVPGVGCSGQSEKIPYETQPQDITVTTDGQSSALITLWRPHDPNGNIGEYTTVQGPGETVIYDSAQGDVYLFEGCNNQDGFVTKREQTYDQKKLAEKIASGDLASWRGHVELSTLVSENQAQIVNGDPTGQTPNQKAAFAQLAYNRIARFAKQIS